MGTFHNMKLNGKSIILTTEQRRALIATNSAKQKEFADSQGLLQLAPIEPKQTLPTSTNVLPSFYESPEWKTFSSSPQVGTQDMYGSPYFGTRGSGSLGKQEDRAYEAFLNRTGNTSMLRGGADYVAPPPEVYPETKGPPLPNGDTMPPVNPNVPAPEAVDTRTPFKN
jgi:hypothetical protein